MLRALALLLVLANVALFVAHRGGYGLPWLDGSSRAGAAAPVREQLRPDEVVGAAAPAPAPEAAAATLCLEVGPFPSEAALEPVEASLAGAGVADGGWIRRLVEQPARWAVLLGPFASDDDRQRRRDELGRRGIRTEPLDEPATLTPGLLLARYEGRPAAEEALPRWTARGVEAARIGMLTPASIQWWLRIDAATAAVQASMTSAGISARPCR